MPINDWLMSYLQYTAKQESPNNYHIWSGLSAISATLRRQVFIDMGHFTVYPNMYVVLVGPAGKCRKTVAINCATRLVSNLNDEDIKISADSITREALIGALKDSTSSVDLNDSIYTHSSLTVISKELSVFLGSNNPNLLSLLTDLYDCPDLWVYKTKGQGTDTLHGVWLNLLGASTPDWLVGSIPLSAIGGGFTSRVMFVVEDAVRHKTALPKITKEELKIKEDLIAGLERMSNLRGEFILNEEAIQFFTNWYLNENIKIEDPRFSGYAERKHIHLLKVALLLSISRGSTQIVSDIDIKGALELINNIEPNMIKAFGSVGRNPSAQDIGFIIDCIQKVGKISREDLINIAWKDVNTTEFERLMETIKEMGNVVEMRGAKTNKKFYVWKEIKEKGEIE